MPNRHTCYRNFVPASLIAKAPTRASLTDAGGQAQVGGAVDGGRGRLGRESVMLKVVDFVETLRDPYTLEEATRLDIDP